MRFYKLVQCKNYLQKYNLFQSKLVKKYDTWRNEILYS
ncbi:hypothetical protein A1OE_184 [Candidatus Endolissoclinum faulkneri L2]|uniref:Uncharacterized protein n=1 Tax=Candidatus Endolissoclinum faulkneri L2 TaxID=1193729 RepID=K7ZC89_9PROT|nr:hypothetical protein A1OE_184 [Candidatus Endolissoclinum faulkneri L2]